MNRINKAKESNQLLSSRSEKKVFFFLLADSQTQQPTKSILLNLIDDSHRR